MPSGPLLRDAAGEYVVDEYGNPMCEHRVLYPLWCDACEGDEG